MLPDAFVYPLRGRGKARLLAFPIFVLGLYLLQYIAQFTVVMIAWALGLVLGVLIFGWLFAYSFEVLGTSARGDREPPEDPDLTTKADLIGPILLAAAVALCSFGPHILYRAVWIREFPPSAVLNVATLIFGVLYFPMAMIGVVLWGSLAGLNPVLIIASIIRVAPSYALVVLTGGALAALVWLAARFGQIPIPHLGSAIAGFVYAAFLLYCVTVLMRLCGLLYYCHEERLGWFGE